MYVNITVDMPENHPASEQDIATLIGRGLRWSSAKQINICGHTDGNMGCVVLKHEEGMVYIHAERDKSDGSYSFHM